MALDYYLVIQNVNNEIEPTQVMESLSQAFSLQKNKNSGFLIGVGVTINVFKEDDEYEESLFGSPYPDICVAFRIDKFEHYETGMNVMLKMVIWLMAYFKDDMIFLLNEQPIFQRMSSQLSLNNDAEFWSPAELSLESQSFQPARVATSVGL